MDSENVGLDFDGVLRKFPKFASWYLEHLSPYDILARARLYRLRRLLVHLFIEKIPVILDGKLIESIKLERPKRIIIVSGRYKAEEQEKVVRLIRRYLRVDKFYFRTDKRESEAAFKARILSQEKIDYYIEDRRYVVEYLKRRRIPVVHVSEVRE